MHTPHWPHRGNTSAIRVSRGCIISVKNLITKKWFCVQFPFDLPFKPLPINDAIESNVWGWVTHTPDPICSHAISQGLLPFPSWSSCLDLHIFRGLSWRYPVSCYQGYGPSLPWSWDIDILHWDFIDMHRIHCYFIDSDGLHCYYIDIHRIHCYFIDINRLHWYFIDFGRLYWYFIDIEILHWYFIELRHGATLSYLILNMDTRLTRTVVGKYHESASLLIIVKLLTTLFLWINSVCFI